MQRIIIASGPVIIEDKKVLLVKEGLTNLWKFPGGKVEDCDKTLKETARRESKEEMNIEIEILDSKSFVLHITKETDEGPMDVILVHYRAKRIGEIKPGTDIREWAWAPVLELDGMEKKGKLMPNIIPTLKHFGIIK